MIGEMCHIRTASPNGPRYDSIQSDAELNQEQNLLLLCPTHHSLIDQATTEYTVERLRSIKQLHEKWVAEKLAHPPLLIDGRQAINLARQVDSSSVDFAIIVALRAEMVALMQYFPELKRSKINGTDVRTYYTAEIPTALDGKYRIVVTILKPMGNLDAAHATADLIRDWSPRFILVNGIAGGLSRQDQEFGDVVVSDSVVYYESGKVGGKGKEYRSKQFLSDGSLLNGLLNLRDSRWKHRLPPRPDGTDETQDIPHLHFGPIASGEKVIACATEARRLLDMNRNLIAVEMESAGVASVAFSAIKRIGFLTVRAICDFADVLKNDDWHEYATHSAASCLRAFLEERPVATSEGNWPEPSISPAPEPAVISVELRKRLFLSLRSAVDMEEFRNFCFLLGVDFDELPGDRKSVMVRELILLFERRGEIQVLESAMVDVLPEARG